MKDVESRLRSLVSGFVGELENLVRQQALESVAQILQEGRGPAAPRRGAGKAAPAAPAAVAKRGPGRPPKAAAAAAKTSPAAVKRRAGEKRPPEELAKLVDQLAEYVRANPGQGVEQISKSMNLPTKDLALPIKKLLGEKRITSKGQKRATKYFPR